MPLGFGLFSIVLKTFDAIHICPRTITKSVTKEKPAYIKHLYSMVFMVNEPAYDFLKIPFSMHNAFIICVYFCAVQLNSVEQSSLCYTNCLFPHIDSSAIGLTYILQQSSNSFIM